MTLQRQTDWPVTIANRYNFPLQSDAINPRRDSGLLEQIGAYGAAGRAVSEIKVVRRGPVTSIRSLLQEMNYFDPGLEFRWRIA